MAMGWLCTVWNDWQRSVLIVKASTVISWHRKGFRLFWAWKVRQGKPGRPAVPKEVRQLIRTMSRENPLWGAPRIHGEFLIGCRRAFKMRFSGAPRRRRSPVGEGPTQGGCWLNLVACERPSRETG